MDSVKTKPQPRLRIVSEYPPEKQKQLLEELVFIDKFSATQKRRHIKTEADLRAFIVGYFIGKQTVSVDGDTT